MRDASPATGFFRRWPRLFTDVAIGATLGGTAVGTLGLSYVQVGLGELAVCGSLEAMEARCVLGFIISGLVLGCIGSWLCRFRERVSRFALGAALGSTAGIQLSGISFPGNPYLANPIHFGSCAVPMAIGGGLFAGLCGAFSSGDPSTLPRRRRETNAEIDLTKRQLWFHEKFSLAAVLSCAAALLLASSFWPICAPPLLFTVIVLIDSRRQTLWGTMAGAVGGIIGCVALRILCDCKFDELGIRPFDSVCVAFGAFYGTGVQIMLTPRPRPCDDMLWQRGQSDDNDLFSEK